MTFRVKTLVGFLLFLILGYIVLYGLQKGHVFYKFNEIQLRNTATEKVTKNADNDILLINRYVAVNNPTLIGKEFKFDAPTKLMVQNVLRHQTFKRKPMSIDPNVPLFDIVAPVTGASSNHYEEFKGNIEHFSEHFPGTKVIFYDLGLDDSQVSKVKTLSFVVYRKFNFDAYPPHVRNLHNYAWKLLIIQEVLAEFDGVMWFDTSVKFGRNGTHILERMARFKTGILFYVGTTGHSILAATSPGMLKYFPLKKSDAVKDMLYASAMIILNTPDVQKHIMKWASVCALKKECIAPPGSRNHCDRSVYRRNKYADCHRFDQSLVNILAAHFYNNEHEKYSLKRGNGFAVMNRINKWVKS